MSKKVLDIKKTFFEYFLSSKMGRGVLAVTGGSGGKPIFDPESVKKKFFLMSGTFCSTFFLTFLLWSFYYCHQSIGLDSSWGTRAPPWAPFLLISNDFSYQQKFSDLYRRTSGDLNDVLIDPAEDWSQVWWSRDHFPSRELIIIRFPRPNFEIAARGQPAADPDFQKIDKKKMIWTHHPIQFFAYNSILQSKSAQNQPRTRFWRFF